MLIKSGITRRIDELGRIVIPKELRINLGIREGEPLEIYVENNCIVIKKFSQIENIIDISKKICSIISDICNIDLMITDREKVIVTSKNLKEFNNKELSNNLKLLIDNRECYISREKDNYFDINKYFIMLPIITNTDCNGLIIIVNNEYREENLVYAKIVQKLIQDSLDVA